MRWFLSGLALVLALFLAFPLAMPVWDSAVYWGAGKFLASGGSNGIWEPLRPPLLPLVFGFSWLFGMQPQVAFLLVGILSLLLVFYSVFSLARGFRLNGFLVFAACLSPALLFALPYGLSELPALALALAALALFSRGRYLFAGFVAALAFLTKFPMGLVFVALLGAVIFSGKERLRSSVVLAAGWSAPVLVFLAANLVVYGDAFIPFSEGSKVIAVAGIWLYSQPWWFYFFESLRNNILLILAPIGAFFTRSRAAIAVTASGTLLFAYFSFMAHKEPRFALLFLPLFGILAAFALSKIRFASIIAAVAVLQVMLLAFSSAHGFDGRFEQFAQQDSSLSGSVLSSTPRPTLFSDAAITPMYYPVFDQDLARAWSRDQIAFETVIVSECDLPCPPDDVSCFDARSKLFSEIEKRALLATIENDGCVWRYFD